jgi:hypothetical protein
MSSQRIIAIPVSRIAACPGYFETMHKVAAELAQALRQIPEVH